MSEQENGGADGYKLRLVVAKKGRSAYISHLDMMRTLTRALARAGVPLKHSTGFHQRAYLSLTRPLSLGYESDGELCDIVLAQKCALETLPERLNRVLPEGMSVKAVLENAVNGREIVWSRYAIFTELPEKWEGNWKDRLAALWLAPDFSVMKRTKKGTYQETAAAEQIRSIELEGAEGGLKITAILRDAPDGGLNPSYLLAAAREKLGFEPLLVRCRRTGFLDAGGNPVGLSTGERA